MVAILPSSGSSYELECKLLEGVAIQGSIIGSVKGDSRSLEYSSYVKKGLLKLKIRNTVPRGF